MRRSTRRHQVEFLSDSDSDTEVPCPILIHAATEKLCSKQAQEA